MPNIKPSILPMEEEPREMPDGLIQQTGACRYCGQIRAFHVARAWSQEDLDEEATLTCGCFESQTYRTRKESYKNAEEIIEKLFTEGNRLRWMYRIELDPALKPLLMQGLDQVAAGIITGMTVNEGRVDIRIWITGSGQIKIKWTYKDMEEAKA